MTESREHAGHNIIYSSSQFSRSVILPGLPDATVQNPESGR
jgi:hypothetical protein